MKKQTDTTSNIPAYVEQKYTNDCGIAALAMLYRTTYERIRQLVLEAADEPFDGTTMDHANAVGEALGDHCTGLYATSANRASLLSFLKGRKCILIVPAKDDSGDFHAVYWTGSEVWDPSPTWKYGRKGIKALKTFTEAWIPQSVLLRSP